MNYYQHIERAVVFVEENLSSKITLDDIAEAACLSKFHFHRVFSALMGESAVDYLRKRRLSKASYDLLFADKKIVEIAFEYQFESPEAFTRAFKSVFNTTPKNYRGERIERIVYEKQGIDENNLSHILYGINKKPEVVDIEEIKLIGCSAIPVNMVRGIVPQGRYAKFTHKGSVRSISLSYVYIFGTWLPKSEYSLSKNPDFERFDDRFVGAFNQKSELDIYIAIAKN